MTPFPMVVRPLTGESAISLISRLSAANGFVLSKVFKTIGEHSGPDYWAEETWRTLADMIGLDASHLDIFRKRNAQIATCHNAVMLFGHPFRPQYLLQSALRICPLCVAERQFLRESWNILHAVSCLDHEVLLVDHCQCGRRLHIKSRGDHPFSCPCGMPYAELAAAPASAEALDGSRWLLDRLGWHYMRSKPEGRRRPILGEPFAGMPVADVLATLDLIGQAASIPADEDTLSEKPRHLIYPKGKIRHRADLPSLVRSVEAAMPIMKRWPEGYYDLLATIGQRTPGADGPCRVDIFPTRAGRLTSMPYAGLDGQPIACLDDAIDAFLTEQGRDVRPRPRARRSTTARLIGRSMSMARVGNLVGVNHRTHAFRRRYDAVLRDFDKRDDLEQLPDLPKLVLTELKCRIARSVDSMSTWKASHYLDSQTSQKSVAGWIHPQLLIPLDGLEEHRTHRIAPIFAISDVHAMRDRIASIAPFVREDDIGPEYKDYSTASKELVGNFYSKADLILDILSGKIPSVRIAAEARLFSLFVHRKKALGVSLAHRVKCLIGTDAHRVIGKCDWYLDILWPTRTDRITTRRAHELSTAGFLKYSTFINPPTYSRKTVRRYLFVDVLERQYLMSGKSVYPEVDEVIVANRRSRPRRERVRLDPIDAQRLSEGDR